MLPSVGGSVHHLGVRFLSLSPLLSLLLSKNKINSPLPSSSDLHASPPVSAGTLEAKSQRADAASATERECQTQAVSMETSSLSCKKATHNPAHTPPPPVPLLSPVTEVAAKDTGSATRSAAVVVGGLEDDKDRIVVEIMQMYSKQQEKLNSTLHKQLQLEMVSWLLERTKTKINEPPPPTPPTHTTGHKCLCLLKVSLTQNMR